MKLGLEDHELRTIEQNYRGDNERCKHEMLSSCLRSSKLPKWKTVADALCLIGQHTVAAKIRKRHCNSPTDSGMCLFSDCRQYVIFSRSMQLVIYNIMVEPCKLSYCHTVPNKFWSFYSDQVPSLESDLLPNGCTPAPLLALADAVVALECSSFICAAKNSRSLYVSRYSELLSLL